MNYGELNWMDIENYLAQDDRLLLVIGACEQHGYLSLLSDVKIPQALADAASKFSGVLVAPPVNFGCSPYFLAYPGTMSLRATTLMDIIEDLIRSAYRQGFRRILILNGHGGNDQARIRITEILDDLPGLCVRWYSWWLAHSVQAVAQKHELKPTHASWLEAFLFTRVADLPATEKVPPFVPGLMGPEEARRVYGDGQFGGPYQAGDDVMDEIFSAALEDVLHQLAFEDG